MITKEIAATLIHRQTVYCSIRTGSDGRPMRARVNGQLQTWVRTPDRWRLPMKHGLSNTFDLDGSNAHLWFTEEQEAIDAANARSTNRA